MCLPSCGHLAAWKLSEVMGFHGVPHHDELLWFSAGAITTDFHAVKEPLRLTVWDFSALAAAGLDTQEILLCLKLCGYISSA